MIITVHDCCRFGALAQIFTCAYMPEGTGSKAEGGGKGKESGAEKAGKKGKLQRERGVRGGSKKRLTPKGTGTGEKGGKGQPKPKGKDGDKKERKLLPNRNGMPIKPSVMSNMVFPLLVRGLGEVSVADLKDLFESCGTVRSCRIAGHGKAIIYFSDRDGQQRGHKLNGTDYEGSTVKTSLLKPSDAASTIKERDDAMSGEDSFSVVVNNVPPGTTHQEMEAAMEKHGEVSKVEPDKKSDTVWFVTYSDKTAARIASKKGARIGRALCKCVRVMPEGMKKAPEGMDAGHEEEEGEEDEDGEGGEGKKAPKDTGEHGKTLTVLVKKLPADATREDIEAVFGDCGGIKDIRIATPAAGKMCFIDFETKTGMRKACKLKKAEIRGTLLEIKHAKNVKDMASWEQSTTPVPRNDPSHKPPDCRTIIVKNLPFDLGDTDDKIKNRIKRVFKACGSVQEVRLFMTYEEVPKFKGIAFVEFREGDAAAAALKMNGRDNEGRIIKVDWVDNKDKALKRKAQLQKSKGINKKPNNGPLGKGNGGGKGGKQYVGNK